MRSNAFEFEKIEKIINSENNFLHLNFALENSESSKN